MRNLELFCNARPINRLHIAYPRKAELQSSTARGRPTPPVVVVVALPPPSLLAARQEQCFAQNCSSVVVAAALRPSPSPFAPRADEEGLIQVVADKVRFGIPNHFGDHFGDDDGPRCGRQSGTDMHLPTMTISTGAAR